MQMDAMKSTDVSMAQNRISEARINAGLSQYDLAALVGTSQSQITKLENGIRKLTREWAERLAPHLKISAQELLFGKSGDNDPNKIDRPSAAQIKSVKVLGYVAAGRWMDHNDYSDVDEEIPMLLGKFATMDQFAYKVFGPSMNMLRIVDGDYVICTPYWVARIAPQDGDVVVIERTRPGGLTERTVKQLVVQPDRYELWPRSTDVRYQKPEVVPRTGDMIEDDETVLTIIGLVIGRFSYI